MAVTGASAVTRAIGLRVFRRFTTGDKTQHM
jgi:hypothetical protein